MAIGGIDRADLAQLDRAPPPDTIRFVGAHRARQRPPGENAFLLLERATSPGETIQGERVFLLGKQAIEPI